MPVSVTYISSYSFMYTSLTDIYYEGTEDDKLGIKLGNDSIITDAAWHFSSDKEDMPCDTVYVLSYDAGNIGTAPGFQLGSGSVTISSDEPSSPYYTFLGWSTSKNAVTAPLQPGDVFELDEDTVIHALWQRNTWTLRYDANGGSGAPEGRTIYSGVQPGASLIKPVREGYTFVCWNTLADGTGTNIDSGGLIPVTGSDVTIYAVWQQNTYTVRFNANGGENAPPNQAKEHGQAVLLDSGVPVREGYEFNGWNTKRSGKGTAYLPGGSYQEDSDVKLYAMWSQEEKSSVLSAAPVSSDPYYSQAARDYMITLAKRADKIQFISSTGSIKTFSRTDAEVTVNNDRTESWRLTASLKADDYRIRAKFGSVWENETFDFPVVYDEKLGIVLSIQPVSNEPYYKRSARLYDISIRGSADKIQFITASGSTLTFTQSNAQITNNGDGTQSWRLMASLNAGTYGVRTKLGTDWNDVSFTYTLEFDGQQASGDDITITVDVIGVRATITVLTPANVKKIQLVADDGTTITYSLDSSVIDSNGQRRWTVVRKVNTGKVLSYSLRIKTTEWIDTGKTIRFVN